MQNDFNLTIHVELGPKTVQLLEALLKPQSQCHCCESAPEDPIDISVAPASEEDMPEFISEKKELTDADLRQVVKAAKDRVGAKPIRAVFASMGIASSVECPAERRSELVEKLNALN